MINVLLTDALIEDVNHYVKRHVLPIEMGNVAYRPISRWDRDEDGRRVADERDERNGDAQRRYNRVPDRHRNALSDGYRSRGTVHPIDGFGSVPVISNVGVPLFDGRGSIWLLVDGIVVVFEDAMIYCIVYSSELQQWLMSEIYSSLVNEYNTLVVEYEKVQRVSSTLPDAAFTVIAPVAVAVADITPTTTVVSSAAENEAHAKINAIALDWSSEPIPFSTETLRSYLDREQYCKWLIEPIPGRRLHHQTRDKFNLWTKVEFAHSVLETRQIETAPHAETYSRHLNNIYLMLALNRLCFIHLFTDIELSITVVGKQMVVTDMFIVRANGITWLVCTYRNDLVNYYRVQLSNEHVLQIIDFMCKRRVYIEHAADIHEWVTKHLM